MAYSIKFSSRYAYRQIDKNNDIKSSADPRLHGSFVFKNQHVWY